MTDGTWELVSAEGAVSTHRLKVTDGWLYRVTTSAPAGVALAFAPSGSGAGTGSVTASGTTAPSDPGTKEADQTTEHRPRLDD